MRELLEISIAVLTIVGILIGATRWLLSVYYEQQRKLAAEKQGRTEAALTSLNETVSKHSEKIQDATTLIQATQTDLKYTNKHLAEVKEDVKDLVKKTDDYTKGVEQRLSKLEVISENLRIMRTPK